MESEDIAQKIIECFLDDMPRQLAALRGYLEAGDTSGADRQFHTIKGASANVGAEALRALTLKIEKTRQAGDIGSDAALMYDLDREFVRLAEAMSTK
jgi:HPt (histidine-containing phosphotransfer) domain-containing protein